MTKNNKILLLIFILLIILIILISYKFVYGYKDNFSFGIMKLGEYDATLDGKQMFPYINDPNYNANILNEYYLNDDTKINDTRLVQHKYQIKSGQYYGDDVPEKKVQVVFSESELSKLIPSIFRR